MGEIICPEKEKCLKEFGENIEWACQSCPQLLSETQVNTLTCKIIKLFNGVPIEQAQRILNYTGKLLCECQVNTNNPRLRAKLEQLEGPGPAAS